MTEPLGEEIDFEIVKEPWNKYGLDDGTILRLKNAVVKVFKSGRTDEMGLPVYGFLGPPLVTALVPKKLMGTPSPDENMKPEDLLSERKFSVIVEEWCEYALANGDVLRTKTVLVKVHTTKKFNKFGEPVYYCSWNILTDKVIKKV